MFALKHQNSDALSYYAINRANTSDTEMEDVMETIVDGLFSMFVTLGNVPIIRALKNTAADMVARKLEKRLRENLWDARNNLFHMDATQAGAFSFQRPLLIILDRNVDLATPLHHAWTYQALAHDVLDFSLNRVVLDDGNDKGHGGAKPKSKKSYDLDSRADSIWKKNKGGEFTAVAAAIQEELDQYRNSEEAIRKLKTSMGTDDDDELGFSLVNDHTQKLTNAVMTVPQMLEQKRLADMHANVATAVLEHIKSQRLDLFFESEEKIMSKLALDRPLIELLKDPEFGKPEDKLRLFFIYYICTPNIPDNEFNRFKSVLSEAGCDLSALPYLERCK